MLAYSGGLDSSFLLTVCVDVLKDDIIAVTADSYTLPRRELQEAKNFAKKLKVRLLIIKTHELKNKHFRNNPPTRCFYCKKELFSKLKTLSKKYKIKHIIDGSNLDDDFDFRPGNKAKEAFGVRSPLKEAALRKADIRLLCKELKLPFWNKPSFACLSSRIPYNQRIEKKTLVRIEKAEDFLMSLGFRQVRVRDFRDIARIEVDKKDIKKLSTIFRQQVTDYLCKLGYKYITVDLEGYRTGSMNLAR